MVFYIVRHGQTHMNAKRLMQGRSDSPLNDNGRMQARAAADEIKNLGIRFNRVISSPLSRAFETAMIVSGFDENHIEKDDRLLEIDFGSFEGGSIEAAMEDKSNPLFLRPHEYHPKIGESYYDLVKRVGGFIDYIRTLDEAQAENEAMLIACHGAVVHAIELYIKGKGMRDFWFPPVNNCSIYRFETGRDGESFEEIFAGFPRE